MRSTKLTVWGIVFCSGTLAAAPPSPLSEREFVKLVRSQAIGALSAEALKLQGDFQKSLSDEIYTPRLKLEHQVSETQESGAAYQPQISPQVRTSMGLQQKTPWGAMADLQIFSTQSTISSMQVQDDTQSGARLTLQWDLWRNIFGKVDRARIQSADLGAKKSELEHKVQIKKIENELRKVFWSLIAVDENIQLTRELLSSAERQAQDAGARNRSGIADRGEVAKFQSQVESRRSSLLLFEFEKSKWLSLLESQLQNFNTSEWQFSAKDVGPSAFSAIQACLVQISKTPEAPLDHTLSDELSEILRQQLDADQIVARSHASWDLGLQGYLQTTGRAQSYGDSFSNLFDEWNSGWGVGLTFSMPLGASADRSEEALYRAQKLRSEALQASIKNEFKSSHQSLLVGLDLLSQSLRTQESNTQNLSVNFQEVTKKFNQGRIPLAVLTAEQDMLFQSQLQVIQIKKQIAHTLLDYFSVFVTHPCPWNTL